MKDLETKGYVVVPNFLDANLIEDFKKNYAMHKEIFLKTHNKFAPAIMPTTFNFRIISYLKPILSQIAEQTILQLDKPLGGALFDNTLIQIDWHQDHEPYFKFKDSYDGMNCGINCWIPLVKEFPNQSGVSVIPHDAFHNLYPEIFKNHIEGKGAKYFIVNNGVTKMKDDFNRVSINIPFDINSIAVSPELKVGDLLIMRQDMIHRTQDLNTNRVAISIRCYPKNAKMIPNLPNYVDWLNSTTDY